MSVPGLLAMKELFYFFFFTSSKDFLSPGREPEEWMFFGASK